RRAVLHEAVEDVAVLGGGAGQDPAAGTEALFDHEPVELRGRVLALLSRLRLGHPTGHSLEHVEHRLVSRLEVLPSRDLDGVLPELGWTLAGRRELAHGVHFPSGLPRPQAAALCAARR